MSTDSSSYHIQATHEKAIPMQSIGSISKGTTWCLFQPTILPGSGISEASVSDTRLSLDILEVSQRCSLKLPRATM